MSGISLKARMKLAGVTMRQIERETGVKYSSINQYLNGYQGISQHKKDLIENFIKNMECFGEEQNEITEPPEVKIRMMCLKMKSLTNGILGILETENISFEEKRDSDTEFSLEDEEKLDKEIDVY